MVYLERVATRPSFLPCSASTRDGGELLPSDYRPRNPEGSTQIFRTDVRGEGFIEEEIHEPDRVDNAARSGVGAPTLLWRGAFVRQGSGHFAAHISILAIQIFLADRVNDRCDLLVAGL